MADVELREFDITPTGFCPCCCKLLYADVDELETRMTTTKTSHCLKRTWVWKARRRRGNTAAKGRETNRDVWLRIRKQRSWQYRLPRFDAKK